MWCYIKSENQEKYLKQYPKFEEIWDELVLIKVNDCCFLPRLFCYNFPSQYLVQYFGKNDIGMATIDLKFKGKLRPAQKQATQIVENLYNKNGYVNAILKLPPGSGKTVLAIYLAIKLKLKTCIILDNSTLLKQWVEAIIKFGGLTEGDIGLIRQNMFVTNKHFTIAMTQTLGSKIKNKFNKTIKLIDESQFGLVIYDEVHSTSASEMFAKVSILFRTPNVIGLSATPWHYGVAELLMKNTIGETVFESKSYEMTPEYNLVYYNSDLKKYSFVMNKMQDYIQRKSYYNKILVKSEPYLSVIVKLVQKMRQDKHNVIIICMTKAQVELISNKLTEIGMVNRKFTGTDTEIDKDNDTIIVATYSYVGKGFDMKRLSGLILASLFSGKKSLVQICGRVLRSSPDKLKPVIYDIIDECFPMLTVPEVNRKRKIIKTEFPDCNIKQFNVIDI